MRVLLYFLIGTAIGIGMALGIWWVLPESLQAVRQEDKQAEIVSAQEIQRIDADITTSRRNAITRAVKEVSPAVVGINVISIREYRTRNPFFDDPFFRGLFPEQVWREKVENLGSGFIISPDGYILTNEHVVHAATQVVVTTTAGEKFDAEIVGYDYDSDVALLKIDGRKLPYVPFDESDEVIIGEWAIAVGNPFGLFAIHSQPSVTVGVVSAVDRDFGRNQDGRLYQDMIQTDASINRGNSGGPLVNSNGRLIGMNTMIFTETGGSIGLGFAIPSGKLRGIYDELKSRGTIDRDFWIGLEIQNVNRLVALSLRLPEVRGVVVTDVEKGSPAAKAGLEATDVIVAIGDRRVDNSGDIQSYLRNSDLRVGDELKLEVIRGGKSKTIVFKLEKKR